MHRAEKAIRLRIFLGEDDKYKGRPLYEEVVVRARQSGLAGATVFKGYMGFGAASGLNPSKLLRTSKDLPVVVEILDAEDKVNAFFPILDKILTCGVTTTESVELRRYSRDKPKPA